MDYPQINLKLPSCSKFELAQFFAQLFDVELLSESDGKQGKEDPLLHLVYQNVKFSFYMVESNFSDPTTVGFYVKTEDELEELFNNATFLNYRLGTLFQISKNSSSSFEILDKDKRSWHFMHSE